MDPWRDPRWVTGIGPGSAVQMSPQGRSDGGGAAAGGGGGGGGVKRNMPSEVEQLQRALFLRSVRQKTQLESALAGFRLSSGLPDYGTASQSTRFWAALGSNALSSPPSPFPGSCFVQSPSEAQATPHKSVRSQLQELERRLLDDDDEDENQGGFAAATAASASASAVTESDWSDAMAQQLIAVPSPAAPVTPQSNGVIRSPTSSSTSTASSSASCSSPSSTYLRQLLSDAAAAVNDGNLDTAATNLSALKSAASMNPLGDAEHRLVSIMANALTMRLNPSVAHPPTDLYGAEQRAGVQTLHELSPCFKLALVTANLAILESAADSSTIHMVDFDINGGFQHAALIQALAERRSSKAALKVTVVADPASPFTAAAIVNHKAIGQRLTKLAERSGINFHFNMATCSLSSLDGSALGCESGEALAVNLAFVLARVPDESVTPENPRDELLRRVRALGPRIVTLVEQELNGNTAPFATRFAEASAHYGALLESLDATVARDYEPRIRVDAGVARKVANIVAREGPDRVERPELFGKWRARMGMAGFRPVTIATAAAESVRARLSSAAGAGRPNPGYTLKDEIGGGLGFGWMGRVISVASAWR